MSEFQKPDFTESLPTGKLKLSVGTWVESTRTPTLKSGRILAANDGFNVYTEWGQDNLSTKKVTKFAQSFSVLISAGTGPGQPTATHVIKAPSVPLQSKITGYSRDGSRKAVINQAGDDNELLEIWDNDCLFKSYDMKELDIHKSIYAPGAWGCTIAWSPDNSKLFYLAEKKIPKAEPFFSSSARRKLDEDCDPENITRGKEYAFRQSWGEQLEGQIECVIVVLDPNTDGFTYFKLPDQVFPYDVHWVGNSSVVGIGLAHKWWRLGMIFCTNRESRIFQIDQSGFRYLSDAGRSSLSPRISPDGQFLFWQDRDILGPHNRSRSIFYRRVYPSAIDSSYDGDGSVVRALELPQGFPPVWDDFPSRCFKPDSKSLYMLTLCDARSYLLLVKRGPDSWLAEIPLSNPVDFHNILDLSDDYLLVSGSTSITTQHVSLLRITSDMFEHVPLEKSKSIHDPEPERFFVNVPQDSDKTPSSILIVPKTSRSKTALVVTPHGGPHSSFVDSFDSETMHYIKLGFAVLKVNYIGSTGSKVDSTEDLTGHISELDVLQVQNIVESCLKENPSLDPKNVFVCGGSHGGFLTAHLIGRYPEFYKAAVMRNPVTDLNSMIGSSDITDWVYVESGLAYTDEASLVPFVTSVGNYDQMAKFSPITYAKNVICPTLLHLGTKDLRVPMNQGYIYYRALKSYGKAIAEMSVYDDNHSLYSPAVRANARIEIVRFLNRFAEPPVFAEL